MRRAGRRMLPGLIGSLTLILMNCASPPRMTVLIKMMPAQEQYFRKEVIAAFEKEHRVQVEVKTYENVTDLPEILKSDSGRNVDLVKTPFEMTRILARQGLVSPVNAIVGKDKMEALKQEYFLLDLVKLQGDYYYMPRKFETRTLIYLKSKVKAASQGWEAYREPLEAALRRYNGRGLPTGYMLEADPNEWDFFDLFVAGYFWSHQEFGGEKKPRIAHRAQRYMGTALGLMDRAFQMGATQEDILRMDTPPITDMFLWQAVSVKEGIFHPGMFDEGWSGGDIWKGFRSGDVFLSDMTQLDAFFLHGAGTSDMPGYLKDPSDMGVAVMSLGVSLELDPGGIPLRTGSRKVTTGGWWWGIPQSSSNKQLAFELAHFITNTRNQIEGCSGFGMVPVRQDILEELSLMFGGGWMTEIFNAASHQLVQNRYTTVPQIEGYWPIGENYIDAFYDIAVTGLGEDLSFDRVLRRLREKYVPRQKAILGREYPTSAPDAPQR